MIKVLDSFVADKIAAGEVIEKPLSIVKELVENSIDAGAGSIIVEIKNGGKTYIRVTDDGAGIPSDELETAFLRHATGKLSTVDDLSRINTLGFRGEALASISAVSRMTVVTRTKDEPFGTRLILHAGKAVSREQMGANCGTTMIAEDVFYNIPARRKFMGSDAREASAIIDLIQRLAVFYANIRFMLINNGRTVLSTNGKGSCLHTIRTVFPEKEFQNLMEVHGDMVTGFISPPGVTKTNRRGQIFFVNGRIVSSKVIEKGLEKGYRGRIFSGYPVAVLFVNVPPDTVDVNIHPGKKEIKFLNDADVEAAVTNAVMSSMDIKQSVTSITAEAGPAASALVSAPASKPAAGNIGDTITEASQLRVEESPKLCEPVTLKDAYKANSSVPEEEPDIREYLRSEAFHSNDSKLEEKSVTINKAENAPFDFNELVLRGAVFNSYIIMEDKNSIYFIDQHAAHERIFYEKLVHQYNSDTHPMQPVLAPFIVEVSPSTYSLERGWLEDVLRIGYDMEDFGDNTFIVRGIPSYMSLEEADSFIRSYMDNIVDTGQSIPVIEKLILKSCKSAVKANNRLSEHEIMALIRDLSQCDNPFCCPHGRPTFIRMTRYELERGFKRV